MGSLSFGHWIVVLLVVILLFGRGRISETMADFGRGIRGFRKGLTDGDDAAAPAGDGEAGGAMVMQADSAPARYE